MKKVVNGKLVEMTPEEIAEMEKFQMDMPIPAPTPEERIADLEEAMELLLSGVTE